MLNKERVPSDHYRDPEQVALLRPFFSHPNLGCLWGVLRDFFFFLAYEIVRLWCGSYKEYETLWIVLSWVKGSDYTFSLSYACTACMRLFIYQPTDRTHNSASIEHRDGRAGENACGGNSSILLDPTVKKNMPSWEILGWGSELHPRPPCKLHDRLWTFPRPDHTFSRDLDAPPLHQQNDLVL